MESLEEQIRESIAQKKTEELVISLIIYENLIYTKYAVINETKH